MGRYSLLLEGSINASSVAPYGFRLLKAGQDVAALGIGETISGKLPSAARSARYDFSLASAGDVRNLSFTVDSADPKSRKENWKKAFVTNMANTSANPNAALKVSLDVSVQSKTMT